MAIEDSPAASAEKGRPSGKRFNERSAGLLNRTQYPSDVIALVVLWRPRYKLSLRDLAEMFLIRGIAFSYEAARDWEAELTPTMAEAPRRRRRGKVGRSWMSTKLTAKSRAAGAISTAPSTHRVRWWTSG
jgi:transposase-like protein